MDLLLTFIIFSQYCSYNLAPPICNLWKIHSTMTYKNKVDRGFLTRKKEITSGDFNAENCYTVIENLRHQAGESVETQKLATKRKLLPLLGCLDKERRCYFVFYFSKHSTLFCISFRCTAQW